MFIILSAVIDQSTLDELAQTLPRMRYEDGRATAGWHAAKVKRNEQARASVTLDLVREKLSAALLAHPVFAAWVRPKALTPLLISKTTGGGHYGTHVDAAMMGGLRVDVSFTLFLSNPGSYEGGELIVETAGGEESFKLDAGSAVVYPASTLHRVAPVTSGERYVAAGWAQSLVRDGAKREILFDLDTAQRRLFEAHGKTAEFDLIAKSANNLLRLWAEP